jgi:FtsH-binding integral membrane protein
MKTRAYILLGIWLVLTGLVHLGGVSFSRSGIILALLGIMTGILFFFADSSEKIGKQIDSILLGTWLVAGGLVSLFHIHVTGSGVILAVLGVAAGVMVLITRR